MALLPAGGTGEGREVCQSLEGIGLIGGHRHATLAEHRHRRDTSP